MQIQYSKLDGHSTEVQTHSGHSIAFNVFALCDPVNLTSDQQTL